MKLPIPLLLLLVAGCGPLYRRTTVIQFRSDSALAGKSGSWHAVEVADAPSPPRVWMQQASSEESQYNLALCEDGTLQNGDVRVQLRALEGRTDQGGGIVWRATSEKNYYLVRWNPLEKSVCVYKVVDGVRSLLQSHPFEAGPGWHTLRAWFSRDKIEVWFDKQSLGEFRDVSFLAPGLVGLWTKADARTQFDDLDIREF